MLWCTVWWMEEEEEEEEEEGNVFDSLGEEELGKEEGRGRDRQQSFWLSR